MMVVISSAIALKRKESRYFLTVMCYFLTVMCYFLTVMCYFLTVMRYLLKVSRYLSKVNRYLSKVNHYLSKVNRYFLKVGRCNQWNDEHEVRFLLDQNAELDFYRASSLKQQSTGRHVAPIGHIIICSYSLVLRA
jgi:hypothetical protein